MIEIHPDREQLAAFRLGKLSDTEMAAVESHVAECESCCRSLKGLPDDSFVLLVRQSNNPTTLSVVRTEVIEREPPADTEIPPDLQNHPRYQILEKLGQGGMCVVSRARHRPMDRVVALKVLRPHLLDRPASVERFRREVKGAGVLVHANIVTAYDAEQAGSPHFLAMEYVPGISLAHLLEKQGRLPIPQACDYIRQAALGLQHAFECGMVHRDIKPQNLMVVSGGVVSGGVVIGADNSNKPDDSTTTHHSQLTPHQIKILDFGLARFVSEAAAGVGQAFSLPEASPEAGAIPNDRLTQSSTLMGTPEYMAPEQAEAAAAADIRADIYSLGCTLYHLLAGHAPFPQGSPLEKVKAHAAQTPRPICEIRPEVPPALGAVIERMLAKDPGRRYQKPVEVAEALAPFADRGAVSQVPDAPAGTLERCPTTRP